MNRTTFSEVVFALRTTPGTLAGGVVLATLTGLVVGLFPAWSANSSPICSARSRP